MRHPIPWNEIYKRCEYIWTRCEKCDWVGYVKKPKRDEKCSNCGGFNLKQRYIIVQTCCNDCDHTGYATQGILKCTECNSENIKILQKRRVLRAVYNYL